MSEVLRGVVDGSTRLYTLTQPVRGHRANHRSSRRDCSARSRWAESRSGPLPSGLAVGQAAEKDGRPTVAAAAMHYAYRRCFPSADAADSVRSGFACARVVAVAAAVIFVHCAVCLCACECVFLLMFKFHPQTVRFRVATNLFSSEISPVS